MTTPEELLCRRSWRLRHSAWTLWGIVTAGLFWWVGFGIIGLRARNKTWLTLAGAFLIPFAIAMIVDLPGKGEASTAASEATGGIIAITWIAGGVIAFFVNRKWLVWRANHGKNGPWYATATASAVGTGAPEFRSTDRVSVADVDAAFRTQAPPPTSQRYPSTPLPPPKAHTAAAPGGPYGQGAEPLGFRHNSPQAAAMLDVNLATSEQLAALPGFDSAWADHVIATRERIGGFKDPSDLVTAAGVQPHIFAALRGRLTVNQPAPSSRPQQGEVRRGRRLEF